MPLLLESESEVAERTLSYSRLGGEVMRHIKEQNRALQRNNTELVMKVRELEKQLKRHGGHTGECRKGVLIGPDLQQAECDCGWAELEKGL